MASPGAAKAAIETAHASTAITLFSIAAPSASGSGDRRFVGALVAVIVGPADHDLVARLAAAEAEGEERVLRHRRSPLGREHRLAVAGGGDVLDEPGRDELPLRILALAGLHLVRH